MRSQTSIASSGQAAGWARSFFGTSRQGTKTAATRKASEFGEAPAVEGKEQIQKDCAP